MARARVTSGRRRTAPVRRKRVWARRQAIVSDITQSAVGAQELLSAFEADYGADPIGATVARTFVQFRATQTAGATMMSTGGGLLVGLLQGPDALDSDELSMLDMETRHQDWSLVKLFHPEGPTSDNYIRGEIDIKAMRKMEELGETYWLALQASVPAQTLQVEYYSATLLLLP